MITVVGILFCTLIHICSKTTTIKKILYNEWHAGFVTLACTSGPISGEDKTCHTETRVYALDSIAELVTDGSIYTHISSCTDKDKKLIITPQKFNYAKIDCPYVIVRTCPCNLFHHLLGLGHLYNCNRRILQSSNIYHHSLQNHHGDTR